jgi:hypothetical protein
MEMTRWAGVLFIVTAAACSQEEKSEYHVTATPLFAPADTTRAGDSMRARGDTVMLRDTVRP